jgi:predicted GH43/DUF377 family glycosyl hydrolase
MIPITWQKMGRIFNPAEISNRVFLKEFAQAPSTLVFDDYIRVYFSCRPAPDKNGQYVSYSAFVDFDRKDLFKILRVSPKPILELGDLGTFDEFGTYPVSVIKHNKNYIAYYAGWTRCFSVPFNVAIGMAISKDGGESFEKIGPGPILSYSHDEPFILSGPKIRFFNGKFYLFYIAGKKWVVDNGRPEPVYRIRLAISKDGYEWEKVERDLISVILEEDEAQASPDVYYKDGSYHMYFCYRRSRDYRNAKNGYRIGYANSKDLFNWERNDLAAGIDVSEKGWDSETISYPHVFSLDDNFYMLYLGNQVGKTGFGIAKMV